MIEPDDDDDPRLSSLRAVWRGLPDEDPPERGLAELMAAARVKAEEMARPSWWQRLGALLRRPPVLALATVLVLIGGAVFVGKHREAVDAQPEVAASERVQGGFVAPAPPRAGSAPAPAPPVEPMYDEEDVTAPLAEAKRAEPAPGPETDRGAGHVERPTPAHEATHRPQRTAPVEHRRAEPRGPGRAASSPTGRAPSSPVFGSARDVQAAGGVSVDAVEAAPPVPRGQALPAPAAANAELATDADDAAPASTTSPTSRVAQYLAQAKSAASRGDCAAARVLLERAASADAAAYRKALASDAALKKCAR